MHLRQKWIIGKLILKTHTFKISKYAFNNTLFKEKIIWILEKTGASLVAQMVKNLPAMQNIWVLSLGWDDPLEKEMATHSSILVWRIPWTEEPGGLQSMGLQRVGHDWATNTHLENILENQWTKHLISDVKKKTTK